MNFQLRRQLLMRKIIFHRGTRQASALNDGFEGNSDPCSSRAWLCLHQTFIMAPDSPERSQQKKRREKGTRKGIKAMKAQKVSAGAKLWMIFWCKLAGCRHKSSSTCCCRFSSLFFADAQEDRNGLKGNLISKNLKWMWKGNKPKSLSLRGAKSRSSSWVKTADNRRKGRQRSSLLS